MRLLYVIFFCCLSLRGVHAQSLVLLTEEYPPFNMSDAKGKVVGISTDIVRQLMAGAGINYTITVSPWMRAMVMAHTQPNHCAFSTSRLAERESEYRWVGPLAFNDFYLFAKQAADKKPASLAEAKGARIGSYFGDGGVAYLQKHGFDVDVAPNDDLNPRKLELGRIDYWASGKLSGLYRLKSQHISGIEPVLKLERGDLYLACHPDMRREQVKQLNALLAEMQKRGDITRIYARYGYTP
jgi:polar amino acid transport system substrate-binding protein